MHKTRANLMKDLGIIALSVAVAIIFVETGVMQKILTSTRELKIVGSLVAGIFFTSIFTTAPATVVLAEIAQSSSVFLVAFFGGLGALLGDWVIFRFIKDRLSDDISLLLKGTKSERFAAIFRLRLFKRLIPFLGALIIASPLPDELGLILMGLSKMKTSLFIPLSFTLNFLGILAIGFIAKAL